MGREERRERERKARRKAILDAARPLFWEHGYAAATMPAIAEAAELAPGTLYLYFPSKDALYVELLVEGYDVLVELLQEAVAASPEPRDQAADLMDAFVSFALKTPEYFDIMFFVLQREGRAVKGGELPPGQVERLLAKENACKDLAAGVLIGSAYGAEDVLQATVDAVWSMLVGLVLCFRKAGDEHLARVASQAKELLLTAAFGPRHP